jgi:hypothetical protein
MKCELLPSPYFSPYDYHIFGLLRDVSHECRFANGEEVKDVVQTWLCAQPKTFFTDDIWKFMDQSNKCMKKLRDYAKE